MDRLTSEVELLGKSEYEIELTKAQGEINKRYADQAAALEAKKTGAKGATLKLINQELANLEELKNSELDILDITKSQTFQYKLQQDEIKRFNDLALKGAEARMAVEESVASIILGAGAKMRDDEDARANKRLPELAKRLAEIAQEERRVAEAARQRVAAQFENDPEGLMAAQDAINQAAATATASRQQQAKEAYDQQRSFVTGWEEAFTAYADNAGNAAKQAGDYFNRFSSGFENAIVKFVQTGKLSFKDLANSLIADFARIAAQKMFLSLFGGPTGGGLLGNFFGFFGKAGGGPVMPGKPYMVGEGGKELFVPSSAGSIIPNNQLGGGNQPVTVNYSIQAVDAASFRSLVAKDPSFIYAVTEQGRRSQPSRSR
jgi:phage-related minor tail protein